MVQVSRYQRHVIVSPDGGLSIGRRAAVYGFRLRSWGRSVVSDAKDASHSAHCMRKATSAVHCSDGRWMISFLCAPLIIMIVVVIHMK